VESKLAFTQYVLVGSMAVLGVATSQLQVAAQPTPPAPIDVAARGRSPSDRPRRSAQAVTVVDLE
jgi:hypothetical protein